MISPSLFTAPLRSSRRQGNDRWFLEYFLSQRTRASAVSIIPSMSGTALVLNVEFREYDTDGFHESKEKRGQIRGMFIGETGSEPEIGKKSGRVLPQPDLLAFMIFAMRATHAFRFRAGTSEVYLVLMISTRLFFRRPSAVVLGAIGLSGPKPRATILLAATPLPASQSLTASARSWESWILR